MLTASITNHMSVKVWVKPAIRTVKWTLCALNGKLLLLAAWAKLLCRSNPSPFRLVARLFRRTSAIALGALRADAAGDLFCKRVLIRLVLLDNDRANRRIRRTFAVARRVDAVLPTIAHWFAHAQCASPRVPPEQSKYSFCLRQSTATCSSWSSLVRCCNRWRNCSLACVDVVVRSGSL